MVCLLKWQAPMAAGCDRKRAGPMIQLRPDCELERFDAPPGEKLFTGTDTLLRRAFVVSSGTDTLLSLA